MEWIYILCGFVAIGLIACLAIIGDKKKEKFDGELYVFEDQNDGYNAGVHFSCLPEDLVVKGKCVLKVTYMDGNYGIKKGD